MVKKQNLDWLKKWYNLTMAETSELMELGKKYKYVFDALYDRVIELGKEIKKRDNRG